MKTNLLLTPILLTGLFAVNTLADWPQFRGPKGDGQSSATKLPTTWSSTQNITWKIPVPEGWSSPIIVDQRIYLTAARPLGDGDKPDLSLCCLCIDLKDGKIIWDKEIFRAKGQDVPRIHKKNSHATPTPIVEGNALYVHFGHQGTAKLNLDGKVLWENRSIDYPPVHGQGCSPILVDDQLVFSCDGKSNPCIVSLDKKTGKLRWKTARTTTPKKSFSFATPTLIEVDGKKQIISPASGAVFAYAPENGEEIWKAPYGEGYSVVPKPLFAHGLIFVSSGFDSPVLMAIRPGGEVAWETKRRAPLTPSMVVAGDELYYLADNGILTCADAKTGTTHWQERSCGAASASLLHANGHVYALGEDGTCVVVKADKEFTVVSTNKLEERVLSSMAISDGAILIRSQQHLYRID